MATFPISDDVQAAVEYAAQIATTNNTAVYVTAEGDGYALTYEKREAGPHHILVPAGGIGILEVNGADKRAYDADRTTLRPRKAVYTPPAVRTITITKRPHADAWAGTITYDNNASMVTIPCASPLAALAAVRDELQQAGYN